MFRNKNLLNKAMRHAQGCGLVLGALYCMPILAQQLPEPRVEHLYNADMTIAEYKKGPLLNTTKSYLHGVEIGLRYSTIINKMNGLPQIFCVPGDKGLTTKDLVAMVDNELAISPDFAAEETLPVAVVLLRGLQRAYPCVRETE